MGAADAVRNRLRILQLFTHEAAHLVAALQAYMQGQVLGACWHKLQTVVLVSCTDNKAHCMRVRLQVSICCAKRLLVSSHVAERMQLLPVAGLVLLTCSLKESVCRLSRSCLLM